MNQNQKETFYESDPMNKETKRLFMAGLCHYIKKKGLKQKDVAARSGTAASIFSRYKVGEQDPGSEWREKVVAVLDVDESDLVAMGKMVAGDVDDKDQVTKSFTVPSGPTDFINSDDVIMAAHSLTAAVMKLAAKNKKPHDRAKMWQRVFEMLPNPTLLIKGGIVIFQNKPSLVFGKATGKPLCETCAVENCPGALCPLKVAIDANQESSFCLWIKGNFYKVIVTQMFYDDCIYLIVSATEINECADRFGDDDRRVEPNRWKIEAE